MILGAVTIGHETLVAIAVGNQQAFCNFFDAYKHKVYSYAYRFTRSNFIAEEITQEVFVIIWNNRATLPSIENIDAWTSKVTRNLCFNRLKKIALEKKHALALAGTTPTIAQPVDDYIAYKDQLGLLGKALDLLSPQQRLVFHLNRDEGLRNEEIARRLNLSTNTVKTHLMSALRKIRHFLASHPAHSILLLFSLLKKIL